MFSFTKVVSLDSDLFSISTTCIVRKKKTKIEISSVTCYLCPHPLYPLLRSLASALEIIFMRSKCFPRIRLTSNLIIFVLSNFIPIKYGSRWLSDDSQPPKGVHNIVRNCPKFGRTKNVWEKLIETVFGRLSTCRIRI